MTPGARLVARRSTSRDPVDALHAAYGDKVPIRSAKPGPAQLPTALFRVTEAGGTVSGVLEGTGGSATVASIFTGDLC